MFKILATEPTGVHMTGTPVCKASPLAPVKLVNSKFDGCPVLKVVRCPYCGGTHEHALEPGALITDFLGGRVAHCLPVRNLRPAEIKHLGLFHGSAEYRLILIEGNPTPAELDRSFPLVSGAWAVLRISEPATTRRTSRRSK
jgi:hypothetical protein